jgi:hypothetical protein
VGVLSTTITERWDALQRAGYDFFCPWNLPRARSAHSNKATILVCTWTLDSHSVSFWADMATGIAVIKTLNEVKI